MKKIILSFLVSGSICVYANQVLTPVNTFLSVFENNAPEADFKVFVGTGELRFLLIHNTSFDIEKTHPHLRESIRVSDRMRIDLIAVTGNEKSIYLKFGGYASGHQKPEEDGPFYISVWREFPDAPEINRQYIRYTQTGSVGRLGLRINAAGDPEIFALENTRVLK